MLSRFQHPNIVQYYASDFVSRSLVLGYLSHGYICHRVNNIVSRLFFNFLTSVGLCLIYQFEDKLYIYLEYVSGGSIHKLLQDYGAFKEPLICNYTRQILQGLAFLHSTNTVHRSGVVSVFGMSVWLLQCLLLLENNPCLCNSGISKVQIS